MSLLRVKKLHEDSCDLCDFAVSKGEARCGNCDADLSLQRQCIDANHLGRPILFIEMQNGEVPLSHANWREMCSQAGYLERSVIEFAMGHPPESRERKELLQLSAVVGAHKAFLFRVKDAY